FTVPDDGRAYLSVTIQPGSGGMVTADGIAAITGAPNYPLVQTPVSPGQVITLPGDGALILVTGGVQQPDASTSELTVGSWDVTLPCDGSLRPPGWSTSAPVDVLVLDAAGSPVPGVDVTFTVDAGGTFGNPDGPPDQRHQSIVVQSNPEGVAAATVSSGTGGEAIIRATIDTGSGPADVAGSPGKVAALADCPSTGDQTLTFASSSLTKAYGDAPFTNALTHIGAGTVTYASSDPSVATVDATTGEVTVHNLGTATITASAAMVPGVWLAAEASYDLTVVPASCGGAAGALTSSDSLVPWSGNGGYDVSHYGIDLAYTPAAGTDPYRIDATTTIDASTTSGTLCSFGLDLYGLTVSSVTVNGIRANFDRIQDASTNMYKLVVTPATPLYGDFTVAVAYSGTPQQLTFHGSGDFAVGWIPNASFTVGSTTYPADGGGVGLGEPVGAFAWYPVNATPSDKASYTTTLTVPTGWQGVAVGDLVSTTAVSPTQDTWTWDEPDAVPSSFTIAAIGRYQAYLGTHTTPGGTVVPLEIYADPILASAGLGPDHYMALTQQLLDWGEAYFGPYTPAVAGYVMKRIPISYALEVYGKPFYAGDYGDSIYVHEFAHQWGGNSVSVADWSDLWLAEGFATYVQWLWAADRGGQTVEQQALSVYNRPATDSLWTVAPAAMRNQGDMFGNWNYDGGALALAALRVGIGPDLAEQVLRDWFTTYAGGNASTQDFIDLAESVSGADLTQWADDYLYSYGKPPSWPTAQEYLPAGTPLLSFADATVTKTVGDAPFTNTLVYDGSGDLTFTSSDTTVATVGTDGLVTITGAGDTTITVDAAAVPGLWAPASASYTLTVQPAAVDPTAKQITSFTVNGLAATIHETYHSITLIVPDGTDLTALAPTIAINGASVSPASGTPQDFSTSAAGVPLRYTVTAADGSTQVYEVRVGYDQPRLMFSYASNGSMSNASPAPGGSSYVTYWVSNNGLGAADDVVVSLPIPAGLDPALVTINRVEPGTYDPATGLWHMGHLDGVDGTGTNVGGGGTLDIQFTIPTTAVTGDEYSFVATIISANGAPVEPDPTAFNPSPPLTYYVVAPGEGWLMPVAHGSTVFPTGTRSSYYMSLGALGTGPVGDVVVHTAIPDGFTFVSA
ncbi:MAG: Ig-like domain-containing protein, partial [Actinomycetia bacterium]|nr:Ig-like domain-containing protein [Actinomycetes bacterium]